MYNGDSLYFYLKGVFLKILSITAQKPDSTGSGVYLSALMDALDELGHEQMLIYGKAPDDEPKGGSIPSLSVDFETQKLPFKICGMSDTMPYPATRYKDMDKTMLLQFKAAYTEVIKGALESFKPDVVICHHLYEVTAIAAHLVDMMPKDERPHIVGITHGTCLLQYQKHDLDNEYIIEGINLLDQVFALTRPQISQIAELFGMKEEKIKLIGTGYNHKLFNSSEISASKNELYHEILYVGKISAQKGVAELIKSLDYVQINPHDVKLTLVGGSSSPDEYERCVKLAENSEYTIEFTGALSQEKLPELYRRSELFVLPSFFEGLPLVIIEALACGTKVVCTDLPGVKEWIDEVLPGASIIFVELPAMLNENTPDPSGLEAFEKRLAQAIDSALSTPVASVDTKHLSWKGLAQKIIKLVGNRGL